MIEDKMPLSEEDLKIKIILLKFLLYLKLFMMTCHPGMKIWTYLQHMKNPSGFNKNEAKHFCEKLNASSIINHEL
jgi:hypothetical protein